MKFVARIIMADGNVYKHSFEAPYVMPRNAAEHLAKEKWIVIGGDGVYSAEIINLEQAMHITVALSSREWGE